MIDGSDQWIRSIVASPLFFPARGQSDLRTGRVAASPRDCWGVRSELAGAAASDVLFGVSLSFRCLFTRPVASEFPFCSFFCSPPSFPRFYEIFLPPSVCFVSPKSQRDSQWGVVGYDLRAGCDVRRGSQRCVGRGARGAVPGMDWAWSWACRTSTGEWMRMGSARRADGRTEGRAGGRADRSLGSSRGRKA